MIQIIVNPFSENRLQEAEVNHAAQLVCDRGLSSSLRHVSVPMQILAFSFVMQNTMASIEFNFASDCKQSIRSRHETELSGIEKETRQTVWRSSVFWLLFSASSLWEVFSSRRLLIFRHQRQRFDSLVVPVDECQLIASLENHQPCNACNCCQLFADAGRVLGIISPENCDAIFLEMLEHLAGGLVSSSWASEALIFQRRLDLVSSFHASLSCVSLEVADADRREDSN
jgi:hypothetical protein